jgi:hypothetical protein
MKEMRSVPDLVEIAHSQAGLSVGDSTNMGRVGEEVFVLLHPSAAEERGIIVRPYGVYACEFDAFGKAEVLILLDQASRDDIGNLLCCSCAFLKHSDTMRDLQCADASFTLPDRKSMLLQEVDILHLCYMPVLFLL